MAALNYERGKYVPQGEFPPVPDGKYRVKISESELKPNKAGTGSYLKLVFDILKPDEYSGRKLFENLNIKHEDTVTRKIAENNLNGILQAIMLQKMNDTNQLLNKFLIVKVITKKDKQDILRNKIKEYFNANESLINQQPEEHQDFKNEFDKAEITEEVSF
jgi:hypothetical protein